MSHCVMCTEVERYLCVTLCGVYRGGRDAHGG